MLPPPPPPPRTISIICVTTAVLPTRVGNSHGRTRRNRRGVQTRGVVGVNDTAKCYQSVTVHFVVGGNPRDAYARNSSTFVYTHIARPAGNFIAVLEALEKVFFFNACTVTTSEVVSDGNAFDGSPRQTVRRRRQ